MSIENDIQDLKRDMEDMQDLVLSLATDEQFVTAKPCYSLLRRLMEIRTLTSQFRIHYPYNGDYEVTAIRGQTLPQEVKTYVEKLRSLGMNITVL